jgi:ribonuclease D
MKKLIYNKYDKHLISELPRVLFKGRIIVILSPGETESAVKYLLSHQILGIDTETRPSFRKGTTFSVALMQVSTVDTCFLFRLNHTGLTPALIQLLEDTRVPKIGLSLKDDFSVLSKRKAFKPGYFIDLQNEVKKIGIEDLSLQKLFANFFGEKISKAQRLSNWEADVLNEKQKRYAATDAWACIKLYEEFKRLSLTSDYELVRVPEPVAEVNVQNKMDKDV